jgi:hypothetical protein
MGLHYEGGATIGRTGLMRPTILVGADKRLTSSLVPKAIPGSDLKLGMKVRVEDAIDLSPHTVVQPGEQGVVAHVDEVDGLVEIKLELLHVGLSEWHNCMWLLPYITEEVLNKITCI